MDTLGRSLTPSTAPLFGEFGGSSVADTVCMCRCALGSCTVLLFEYQYYSSRVHNCNHYDALQHYIMFWARNGTCHNVMDHSTTHEQYALPRTMQVVFVSADEICMALSASLCNIRFPSITTSRIALVGSPLPTLKPPFESMILPR
eukprot:COSAG02_NODE_8022_length_2743_cov_3.322239_1_plen_146_part_00